MLPLAESMSVAIPRQPQGLTVTTMRDPYSGDQALDAGALSLGIEAYAIDEFDKMPMQEHDSLLEAMEQQSISVAKAGIGAASPHTTILAAANPIGGHYNKGKTVNENIRMKSALLSRFDLIFILLDKPDEDRDGLLSRHLMNRYRKQSSINMSASAAASVANALHPRTPSVRSFSQASRDMFSLLGVAGRGRPG